MSFDKRVWKGALLVSIFLVLFTTTAAAAWSPDDMKNDMQETFDAKFGPDSGSDSAADDRTGDRETTDISQSDQVVNDDSTSWVWGGSSSAPGDSNPDDSSDASDDSTDRSTSWVWGDSASPLDSGSGSDSSGSDSSTSWVWGDSSSPLDSGSDSSSDDSSGDSSGSDTVHEDSGSDSDTGGDSIGSTEPVTTPSGSLEEQAEQYVLENLNQERQQRGLGTLSHSDGLQTTARTKSQDMAQRNYFAHTSPSGEGFRDLFNRYGVSCMRGGENLARTWFERSVRTGSGGSVYYDDAKSLADGLTRQWMNSDGHRRAILRSAYNTAGVGIEITSSGQVYATTHFCT